MTIETVTKQRAPSRGAAGMPPARPGASATKKPQTFTTLQFECETTGGLVEYEVPSDADVLVRADVHAPSNEVISKSFTIPYFRSKMYFGIKAPGFKADLNDEQVAAILKYASAEKSDLRCTIDSPSKDFPIDLKD